MQRGCSEGSAVLTAGEQARGDGPTHADTPPPPPYHIACHPNPLTMHREGPFLKDKTHYYDPKSIICKIQICEGIQKRVMLRAVVLVAGRSPRSIPANSCSLGSLTLKLMPSTTEAVVGLTCRQEGSHKQHSPNQRLCYSDLCSVQRGLNEMCIMWTVDTVLLGVGGRFRITWCVFLRLFQCSILGSLVVGFYP